MAVNVILCIAFGFLFQHLIRSSTTIDVWIGRYLGSTTRILVFLLIFFLGLNFGAADLDNQTVNVLLISATFAVATIAFTIAFVFLFRKIPHQAKNQDEKTT